jgi:hypothetical protein
MRNNAHYEFADEARTLYNACASTETSLAPTASQLNATVNEERNNLDAARGSELTPELKGLDGNRDNTHQGLVSTLEGATHHSNPEIAAAAVKLLEVTKHYGNIPRLPYDDASAAYGDLLREMSTPAHMAMVSLVGVASWLSDLGAANAAFIEKMLERYAETDHAKATGKMKAARANSDEKLNAALDKVDALVITGPTVSAAVAKFIHDYNELAERHKHILAIERGHRKASAASADEESTEDDNAEEGE